jgi:hypothetical protein
MEAYTSGSALRLFKPVFHEKQVESTGRIAFMSFRKLVGILKDGLFFYYSFFNKLSSASRAAIRPASLILEARPTPSREPYS